MAGFERAGAWTCRESPGAITLSRGDEATWAFDLEGRPITWWRAGITYKRSLASRVHVRERGPGGKRRGVLDEASSRRAFETLLAEVSESPFVERTAIVARWTPERLLAERERFEAVYRPITILPPDQYASLVVQAAFGCSWNRCTFCSFYQDRPFAVRPAEEFAAHLEAVAGFLGRAAEGRRSIFLADGNALVLANERLGPIFEAARRTFPGRPLAGFVDVFGGERKAVSSWAELSSWGLARVHVGLETGHGPLLRFLNKPGSADEAFAFVRDLKEAGLAVAVIFMVGAGGERHAESHLEASASLCARLPLGRGDIVYLSPFVEHPGSEYARRAAAEGIVPLGPEAIEAQRTALERRVRAALPEATVARYDIREFVY